MNEIVKLVSQKAGISEDVANKAVTAVLDYLKGKLPAPIAGQINALLSSGAPVAGAKDAVNNFAGQMTNTKPVA
jgi:uncharacterized protein (DUF2267 family)